MGDSNEVGRRVGIGRRTLRGVTSPAGNCLMSQHLQLQEAANAAARQANRVRRRNVPERRAGTPRR